MHLHCYLVHRRRSCESHHTVRTSLTMMSCSYEPRQFRYFTNELGGHRVETTHNIQCTQMCEALSGCFNSQHLITGNIVWPLFNKRFSAVISHMLLLPSTMPNTCLGWKACFAPSIIDDANHMRLAHVHTDPQSSAGNQWSTEKLRQILRPNRTRYVLCLHSGLGQLPDNRPI